MKRALSIPVLANGNVRTLADAEACLAYTGAPSGIVLQIGHHPLATRLQADDMCRDLCANRHPGHRSLHRLCAASKAIASGLQVAQACWQ